MSREHDSAQEPTEPPGERKLRQSRAEGQVPRSKELVMALQLLAFSFFLLIIGPSAPDSLVQLCRLTLGMHPAEIVDASYMISRLQFSGSVIVGFALPLLAIITVAAIVGSLMTGGLILSLKAARPKWERLNPIAGLKRLMSLQTLAELVKAILKTVVFSLILFLFMRHKLPTMMAAGQQDPRPAIEVLQTLVVNAMVCFSLGFLVIGLLDVPWQIYRHNRQLMMTKQEAKEGHKEEEGSQETKERIKRVRKEQSNRRMLQVVPDADVIITNPDHIAIALRYDPFSKKRQSAPILIAKGSDLIAEKIVEIAKKSGKPVICQPPLARAVFYNVEIDHPIPAGLYTAVARVMAYVYLLNNYLAKRQGEPPSMMDIPIPKQYQHE
ncbi:EscU/YscU/HrcU family type III secretion system export apparatus switch protein [Parendozoicomonas sp. Alg238-R29]|uniref:EscU/YscU/HrcU family type III secretion system export apparatus switch protein n=1 Tax=Parendozoicomonas sp. Alg238-R29 TaxID=2993446 RepID=UPI00248E431A|nr:EscU/YscU/HrcU family type III secretion system export apparatus switch protein [Parendozoicomonas sp. Alg238-R29]